jgi:hypothetical protein
MKLLSVRIAAALALLMVGSGADARAVHPRASGGCDRACLTGLVDTYVAALGAKDPSRLPLAPKVKFTENTNAMRLGDGLWGTVTGIGSFKLYVADPVTHQVAFYGTAKENGQTVLFGVRLKEENRRLSEIETYVIRKATGIHGTFDALTEAAPIWSQPLAPSERLPRAAMIKAVNLYFDGIEQGNGDIVPFDDDTIRIENGRQTAPTIANTTRPALSARAQMSSKTFNYIPHVTQRRYLVVDEEHGIVFGTFMFQHPGNIPRPGNASGVPPMPGVVDLASFPNTTEIVEAFKVSGGRLKQIFALVSLLPYRQSPGW